MKHNFGEKNNYEITQSLQKTIWIYKPTFILKYFPPEKNAVSTFCTSLGFYDILNSFSKEKYCHIAVGRSPLQDGGNTIGIVYSISTMNHQFDWNLGCLLVMSLGWNVFPEGKLEFCLLLSSSMTTSAMRKIFTISKSTCFTVEIETTVQLGLWFITATLFFSVGW